MAGITTAVCGQAKSDAFFGAAHCFNATVTATGNSATSAILSGLSSGAGISTGMAVSGGDAPAGCTVVGWNSATSVNVSPALTGTHSGLTYTFTADPFKCALIKYGMAGTYGAASTNYTDVTGNSDEATGTGYTAGGFALTNSGPSISSNIAFTTFSVNPSWTSATLSVEGMVIYNNAQRQSVATRAIGFHDFGGQQQVTAGTLTVIMPTANSSSAIYRVS
jgi:hypothetical protein